MDIFKVIGIALIGGLLSLFLREYKKEFAIGVSLVCAIIIMSYTAEAVISVVNSIFQITQKSGVDKKYFEIIIKVVGTSYITQYGGELLRDCGESAIAQKVFLAGKVFILFMTMPIIEGFLEVCIETIGYI